MALSRNEIPINAIPKGKLWRTAFSERDASVIGMHWGGYDYSLSEENRFNVAKNFERIAEASPLLQGVLGSPGRTMSEYDIEENDVATSQRTALTAGLGETKVGWLELASEPAGASVFINNQLIGKTPIRQASFPIGAYNMRLSLEGYQDLYGRFRIENEETTQGSLNLQALPLGPISSRLSALEDSSSPPSISASAPNSAPNSYSNSDNPRVATVNTPMNTSVNTPVSTPASPPAVDAASGLALEVNSTATAEDIPELNPETSEHGSRQLEIPTTLPEAQRPHRRFSRP
ncbi:MAG: PEGA domain-containing protein [Deinococcales bacterium]